MFNFSTTYKHHFHSTKLVQDMISKNRNILHNVPNLIRFGGLAHHKQHNARLKCFLSVAIPFKYCDLVYFYRIQNTYQFICVSLARCLRIGVGCSRVGRIVKGLASLRLEVEVLGVVVGAWPRPEFRQAGVVLNARAHPYPLDEFPVICPQDVAGSPVLLLVCT